MGIVADDPRLVKCRTWVLAHGGVTACNTFTKMYLCALGQYDYDAVPAIPPEIVLFPEVVLLQYLRDLCVVPLDSCAAGHHLRQEAFQEDSAGAGN